MSKNDRTFFICILTGRAINLHKVHRTKGVDRVRGLRTSFELLRATDLQRQQVIVGEVLVATPTGLEWQKHMWAIDGTHLQKPQLDLVEAKPVTPQIPKLL